MTYLIKWKDHETEQSGAFEAAGSHGWIALGRARITANSEVTFAIETDFDDGDDPYETFVTLNSDSLHHGVKISPSGGPVSLSCKSGTSPIEFRASVLISGDPKVKVTPIQGSGSAECVMTWTGREWQFSGDGVPRAGSCEFVVSATNLSIRIENQVSGTSCAVYQATDASLTRGKVLATGDGSELHVAIGLEAGGAEQIYIANVFRKLDSTGTLNVES